MTYGKFTIELIQSKINIVFSSERIYESNKRREFFEDYQSLLLKKGKGKVRVISGKAKGIRLNSLEGLETRPTLDRVKEALFSKIQFEIPNSVVLDLFSGSGGLGIESLSRDAKMVVFCDNSYKSIKIIEENLQKAKLKNEAIIINKDYIKCLEDLKTKYKIKFNIIFLDPPYNTNYVGLAIEKIFELDLLEEDGIIVTETDKESEILKNPNIKIYDIKKYGRVKLMFLTRKG